MGTRRGNVPLAPVMRTVLPASLLALKTPAIVLVELISRRDLPSHLDVFRPFASSHTPHGMNSLLRTRGAARVLSRSHPRAALSTSRISHSASPNPLDPLASPSSSAATPTSPAFSSPDAQDVNTHFGFKDVPESAKESMGAFSPVRL